MRHAKELRPSLRHAATLRAVHGYIPHILRVGHSKLRGTTALGEGRKDLADRCPRILLPTYTNDTS